MRITNGGISFKELVDMPYMKYLIIRKAAEIDEVESRLTLISDVNAAFSGNEDYIKMLKKLLKELKGHDIIEENVKPTMNWVERLERFKR